MANAPKKLYVLNKALPPLTIRPDLVKASLRDLSNHPGEEIGRTGSGKPVHAPSPYHIEHHARAPKNKFSGSQAAKNHSSAISALAAQHTHSVKNSDYTQQDHEDAAKVHFNHNPSGMPGHVRDAHIAVGTAHIKEARVHIPARDSSYTNKSLFIKLPNKGEK